ncbi:universal stress protein [Saccharopolyspora sp. NPDC049357]
MDRSANRPRTVSARSGPGQSASPGATGLLLGSTSQQLLQHSPCPVIVAR